ncbi:hypothetical protein NI17_007830 [Thermobifida halotolerans]|uniref:Uncharacterized protein n=1 Tax=Thermobifida halotolerans TaxID=483545 RepID=A0A399G9A9_9ACTN|nr:hypothetical protein [Thermobifida halotolerans]UOE21046.1 hypothetical protein NI17_007830 [Thermobifida halotolerans]
MDFSPLVLTEDRFPTGLPGRRVPVRVEQPSAHRPWGMDQARPPLPVSFSGKHEKPTTTRQETVPTQYSEDSEVRPDDYTQTVTD